MPTELRVVGTVEASAIVQIKSHDSPGSSQRVAFTEGQNVTNGDLLFDIDPRPYEDALRQAEAAVERDRAQIAQTEATLARDAAQAKYAETDAARYAELAKAGVVSRAAIRPDPHQRRCGPRNRPRHRRPASRAPRPPWTADDAAVAAAKLNLSYCEIHAPISGRTGNLLVHAGNLVKVNDVPLVVIHQVAPIFVNFSVPEQHLAAIRRLNAAHRLAGQRLRPGRSRPRFVRRATSGDRQHRGYHHRHHSPEGHLR